MRTPCLLAVFGLIFLATGPARADRRFAAVPAGEGGKSSLELRVVTYDGAVNGELTVEVHNRGKADAAFDARGLYFVPDGSADQAPQRLGSVGPMQVATGKGWERRDSLKISAGATVKVKLDVFCIDSHRSSPGKGTGFALAGKRMPKELTTAIQADGAVAAGKAGGFAAPAAKAAIQSEVWRERDHEWVELQGEGKQEVGK